MSRTARAAALPPFRRPSAANTSPIIRSRASSNSSTATVTPTTASSSVNTVSTPATPAAQPPSTPIRQNMSLEQAKKELLDRKLILTTNSFSLNNLVNILLCFTGREESADGLGEPWEIVVAVGVILEKEMVRLAAEATADATASRMQSLLEAARDEARKEVASRKDMLDKIEDALDEREARVRESENKAEEEREEVAASKFELEGDRKKFLEDALKVDSLISRFGEVVERSEKERKEWEEIRKEGKTGAPAAPPAQATNGRPWVGAWGDSAMEPDTGTGWGYQGVEYGLDARGTVGSYAEAAARGENGGSVPNALSEQDLARGKERMQRGEEKRERQLLLDADVVAGENGLKGLKEADLLNRATKVVEGMNEVELLEGKPAGLAFAKATTQNNGGVLYELNTKEARDWLARPDVCNKFTDEFGFGAKIRERKFPVLVEFVPIGIDISKRATIETIEADNNLEKGSILGTKWVRNPAMREPGQRHAHLIVNCRTKEIANGWIAGLRAIGGKDCTSVKLLPEPLRCYNCQLPGHQANKCLSPQVCGTCGGQHRTDKCTNRLNVYCVTCKEKGTHPTWSPACPGYVTRCTNLSDRIPDNRYRYYVTSENWTWELLTNDTYRRRMKIPNSRRPPASTPAQDTPATGANTVTPNSNREHPRPENLARPAPGGSVTGSRQTQITEYTNAPGDSGTSQPTQPLVPNSTTNA